MRVLVHDYSGHPFQVQLSRALAGRGHEVLHIHCSSYETGKGALAKTADDPAGFDVVALPMDRTFNRYSPVRRVVQEWRYGEAFSKRAAAFAPDVILSSNDPLFAKARAARWCRSAGVPWVYWLQDVYSVAMGNYAKGRIPVAGQWLAGGFEAVERRLLKQAAAVVAITDDFLPLLASWGVPADRCHVVENWAPLGEIDVLPRKNPWSTEHGLDGVRVALYAGTLGLKHNPALLLELARQGEPDRVVVVVASEGLGADWLREHADAERVGNMHVLPFQPWEQMSAVLASADLLVTLLEPEAGVFSVPSKVLTYECAARPILGAIPAGNLAARTILDAGAGVVVAPDDVDGFVREARLLLGDAERCEQFGQAARRHAEAAFAIDPIADIFETVLADAARAPVAAREGVMPPTDVKTPLGGTTPTLPTTPRPRAAAVLRVQQARAQYRRPAKQTAAPFVGDGSTWGPLERANGVLFVAFIAVLTLEWISLGGGGGGQIKYFHVAAIGFIVTFSLRYRPRQTIAPYLVANRTFYVPYLVYLCAVGAGGFVHTPPEFTHSDLIRQLFYSGTGIFIGAFIAVSYNRRVRQYFLYTGIAAVSVLLVMMTLALGSHGTNPVSVFIQAMKTQNPDILTNDLLKGTFRSQDLAAAGANLRHKVFAAVLIGVYVSLMYMPKDLRVRRRGTWRVVIFFAVLGVLLIFVSLSRSIMICVIVAVGLVALRVFLRAKATPRTALAYSAVVAGALLVLVSPMGALLQQRFFQQTSSYTARSSAVSDFMGIAGKAAVSGLSATQITFTPHNIVLDAWMSGGVIAALAAAGFVGWLALLWVREVHRYLFSTGGWYLSSNQFFVMAIGFEPLVRAFTAGDGFHMTEWTCVGIFLGSLYANSIAARNAPAQPNAASPPGGDGTAVPGRVVTPTLADALAARTARLRASRHGRRPVTVRRAATVSGARSADTSTRGQ